MNFLIWNSRGIGARSFPALVRNLKAHYHLDFITLLETRCTKEMSLSRANQLGFSNFELMDCEGYSSGIWCLWDNTISSVAMIECHHQFVHFQISRVAGDTWTCTIIYASPSGAARRTLWDNLSRLAPSVQGARLLGGDFNSTLLLEERRSSAIFRSFVDRDFLQWFDSNEMSDFGFVGLEFTWKRGTSEARLDRALANEQWVNLFPNASVTHLPFFKSDHRPLLLRLNTVMNRPKPDRPFRFIAAWVLHEQFDSFVRQSWLPHAL
ncbi:hypothetical protein QN277_028635 [Acacia crassicarpa]|uniref:Endonuclease/exonuclease/phosphatase domain-containing protein n=1 Tax=Acacia crassicarpa TaxID=499986 RepID=A0AAE1MIJ5_9FABA|nr:hypothetical protein QN277_028635 [Acacia crassicarpa]